MAYGYNQFGGIGSAEIKKSIKRRQDPISAGSPTIRFTFEKTIGLRTHDVAIKVGVDNGEYALSCPLPLLFGLFVSDHIGFDFLYDIFRDIRHCDSRYNVFSRIIYAQILNILKLRMNGTKSHPPVHQQLQGIF